MSTNFDRRITEGLIRDIGSGRFSRDTLPILPDHSVRWELHDLPDDMGLLALPMTARPDVVSLLAEVSLGQYRSEPPKQVLSGDHGHVEIRGGLAVKKFFAQPNPNHAGLPGIQANSVIHAGLVRMGSGASMAGQKVSAPEQLGALMRCTEDTAPVWVMTRGRGVSGRIARMLVPETPDRAPVLHQAILACGGDVDSIWLDDKVANYLVDQETGDLIRIDVAAREGRTVVPGTEGIGFGLG